MRKNIKPKNPTSNSTVLLVGRLSGPKNTVLLNILRQVAPRVIRQVSRARFVVVGGPVTEEHRKLEKQFSYLSFEGHQKKLEPYYRKAAVVVGAGRVALEAMNLKRPVVAIGERKYVGPLLPEKIEEAKATNFGDCWDEESFDWAQMVRDLTNLLKSSDVRKKVIQTGYDLVQKEYNMARVFPKMEFLYGQVLLEKNLSSLHELPVLMYHRVSPTAPASSKHNLQISQAEMERHLLFLRDRGFEAIGFEDLLTRKIPRKPIILTFDDGYEDNYRYLFPLLRKHKMKIVMFLLGNRKHKTNFWDAADGEEPAALLKPGQILEMAKSGLVEFGAHSLNHSKLTELGSKEIEREVVGSKKALETFLKKPVLSFAYPYGFTNEKIKKITQVAGFTFGIAVNTGPTRFGKDLLEIRRIHMFPNTSPFKYFKKTSGYYLRYRGLLGK